MSKFNIQKIHQTVWVFKNALTENEEIIDYLIENREWSDWYTFGTMASGCGFVYSFDNFPNEEEWKNKVDISGYDNSKNNGYFENKINDLFYETTKLYVEENSLNFDNWVYQGWNIAKYTEHPDDDYAMMFHTDFIRDIEYTPGDKFSITAVFYPNDNYVGGEVLFRFLDEDKNIVEDYSYKPEAGDIVVFMSGHPHYHGVKATTKGEKYIIRTYWRYKYEGHPLWLKLQEKYGSEVWEEMEKNRLRFNRVPENMNILHNIQFFMPFEEYYKEEIKGLDI